jgi:tetratricopeptide (TPR) repeat protein
MKISEISEISEISKISKISEISEISKIEKDIEEVRRLKRKLSCNIPDNEKRFCEQIIKLYSRIYYEKAKRNIGPYKVIDMLNIAINFYDGNSKYFKLRSLSYSECFNYNKALDDISRAIILDENNYNFYIIRANIYYDLNQYHNGIKDIEKVIELESSMNQSASLLSLYYILNYKLRKYLYCQKILKKLKKLKVPSGYIANKREYTIRKIKNKIFRKDVTKW